MKTYAILGLCGVLVLVGVLSMSNPALAVDSDGDGRAQTLTVVNDPNLGLIAKYSASTTVFADNEIEVTLDVQAASNNNAKLTVVQSSAIGQSVPSLVNQWDGVPLLNVATGDLVELTAVYKDSNGNIVDTETISVNVP